jgi:epsin
MQLAKRLYKTAKAGVIGSTGIEIMVKEATNSDACGPAGTTLSELSDLVSKSHEHRQEALQTLLTRLELPAENWCKIYKALLVIEYLAKNSVSGVVEDLKDVMFGEIERKVKFKFVALETGRDEGAQVRAKATAIVNLLNDAELLGKEREATVAAEAEKMGSGGSKPLCHTTVTSNL